MSYYKSWCFIFSIPFLKIFILLSYLYLISLHRHQFIEFASCIFSSFQLSKHLVEGNELKLNFYLKIFRKKMNLPPLVESYPTFVRPTFIFFLIFYFLIATTHVNIVKLEPLSSLNMKKSFKIETN